MAFVGVAFSINGSETGVVPTAAELAEASTLAPGTKEKTHPSPRVDGQTWYAGPATCVLFGYVLPGARQDPNS